MIKIKRSNIKFWCIVTYKGDILMYYMGFYHLDTPVFTSNFDHALKLHNEQEAQRIWSHMPYKMDLKIEEHMMCEG